MSRVGLGGSEKRSGSKSENQGNSATQKGLFNLNNNPTEYINPFHLNKSDLLSARFVLPLASWPLPS